MSQGQRRLTGLFPIQDWDWSRQLQEFEHQPFSLLEALPLYNTFNMAWISQQWSDRCPSFTLKPELNLYFCRAKIFQTLRWTKEQISLSKPPGFLPGLVYFAYILFFIESCPVKKTS